MSYKRFLFIATLAISFGPSAAFSAGQPTPEPPPLAGEQQSEDPKDPYKFCYFEGEAYSEGSYLDKAKCVRKINMMAPTSHPLGAPLIWEYDFYKQG